MRRGPVVLLLLAVLLCAGYAARRLEQESWDSLLRYMPPYTQTAAAAAGTAPAAPMAQRLVLVIVDGLNSSDATRLPTLAFLHEQGAYRSLSPSPNPWPRTAWATLMTGASPALNGVAMDSQPSRALVADNLAAAARRGGKSVAAAGNPALGIMLGPWLDRGFFEVAARSTSIGAPLVEWLRNRVAAGGPDLIVLELPFPHATGQAAPPDARHAALAALDSALAQFLDQVDLHTTALAVVGSLTVHDGGQQTATDAAQTAPFLMAGPGVVPGPGPTLQPEDVAPTLAVMLGAPLPGWAEGEPQWGMLRIDPPTLPARLQGLVAQQRAFYGAYAGAFGYQVDLPTPPAEPQAVHRYLAALRTWAGQAKQAALRLGILHRLPWVAGAWLVILLYFWLVSSQPYSLSLTLGALAYSALYYSLFFAGGGRYSPGMTGLEPLAAGLLQHQYWLAAIGMAVASLYLGWHLGRRGFRRGAYVCLISLHTCLVSLGLVAAQALVPVLVQGFNWRWFLPDTGWTLYYFFGLQQIMMLGFGAPLWMFLSLVTARMTIAGVRSESAAVADSRVISLPERHRLPRRGRPRSY